MKSPNCCSVLAMNDLPHDLAKALAGRAGLGIPKALVPLTGGRNNRVFRVDFKGGAAAVLKSYYYDSRDPRDRLRAEWGFLNYVTARGVRNVPRPLAIDAATHSALYSFVIGERPKNVDGDLVRQAAEFAVAINRAPNEADSLDPASEACFSLVSHLETVDRRVARLRELDPDIPHVEAARTFVEDRLKAMWDRVKSGVIQQAAKRDISPTNPVRAVVSPSDFGFHNSLIDPHGRASFLDFEYAGRDDPAKLICDFFCQPELSAPIRHYAEFTGHLARPLALRDEDLWRAEVLLDAYRVKWVCIMLNEFSPLGARRRAFASSDESGAHAAQQLRSAEHYLELISP
jgi:phosphotransferase family enzyme